MAFDLNAVRDFVAVARAASLSEAGRLLGVPKSTLSKRLQALESALGARLIERTTRKFRLTAEGRDLLEHAKRIATEAETAERAFRDRQTEPAGVLRLSAPHLFAHVFMGAIVAKLRERHPHVTVDVALSDARVDLVAGGFDAAIRVGDLPDTRQISRPIAVSRNVIVAAPALARALKGVRTPAEAADFPALAFTTDGRGAVRWEIEHGKTAVALDLTPVVTIGSLPALRDAAVAGAGVAFLPHFLVADDLHTGRLALVLEGWTGRSTPISVVYPSARSLTPRLRAFIDIAVEAFPNRRLAGRGASRPA